MAYVSSQAQRGLLCRAQGCPNGHQRAGMQLSAKLHSLGPIAALGGARGPGGLRQREPTPIRPPWATSPVRGCWLFGTGAQKRPWDLPCQKIKRSSWHIRIINLFARKNQRGQRGHLSRQWPPLAWPLATTPLEVS